MEQIKQSNTEIYIETSNAFLKLFYDIAVEAFPDLKVIHLIRNPLEVAKSNLNRYRMIRLMNIPHKYIGDDGNPYMNWTLTGKEDFFGVEDLYTQIQLQFEGGEDLMSD